MNRYYYDKLVNQMAREGMDAMLLAPSFELDFIMGNSPLLCERFQALFIKKDGSCFYICNLLSASEVRRMLGADVPVYQWFDGDDYLDVVRRAFSEQGLLGGVIGVNTTAQVNNILQIAQALNVSFKPGRGLLQEIRMIKTPEEIAGLREAAHRADRVFQEVLHFIRPGMHEYEIKNKIAALFTELEMPVNGSTVASGPNSSYPHYVDKQRVIEEKDILLLGFGGVYKGLYADMSRTVFVGGVTEEERKVWQLVKDANLAGIAAAHEGAFIPDVDKAARDVIEQAGYGRYFTTRLGHGIGYEEHEAPDIKKSNPRFMERNIAFSIEPGVYIDGRFGVRIEDICALTEDGLQILNQASKELIVI
jgi:Xaa-Pro dipeptidase